MDDCTPTGLPDSPPSGDGLLDDLQGGILGEGDLVGQLSRVGLPCLVHLTGSTRQGMLWRGGGEGRGGEGQTEGKGEGEGEVWESGSGGRKKGR